MTFLNALLSYMGYGFFIFGIDSQKGRILSGKKCFMSSPKSTVPPTTEQFIFFMTNECDCHEKNESCLLISSLNIEIFFMTSYEKTRDV